MRAIRVGFILASVNSGWLGGLNYFRSLLTAIDLIPQGRIEAVVFLGNRANRDLNEDFGCATIVRSSIIDHTSFPGFVQRATRKLLRKNPLLISLLRRHRIDVLSHYGPLEASSGLRTVGWIPDFQHIHLPQYFTETERKMRDAEFRRTIAGCNLLIVSSNSACADLTRFAPESAAKARVLHFVPSISSTVSIPNLKGLQIKYGFTAPYFYLPNQFWTHKNHSIVIDALIELHHSNIHPLVIASGNTHDPRNPGHYENLLQRAAAGGVSNQFKSLGIIPYPDLVGLMKYSEAVINPSLFEGWSTTVEEAKAMGKPILLSRIPVHEEQDPAQGIFFDPSDARGLAEIMERTLNIPQCSNGFIMTSPTVMRRQFAEQYQRILLELVGNQ